MGISGILQIPTFPRKDRKTPNIMPDTNKKDIRPTELNCPSKWEEMVRDGFIISDTPHGDEPDMIIFPMDEGMTPEIGEDRDLIIFPSIPDDAGTRLSLMA